MYLYLQKSRLSQKPKESPSSLPDKFYTHNHIYDVAQET